MELKEISKEYENEIMEYRREFLLNEDKLHGCGGLVKHDNFHDWMEYNRLNENPQTVKEGYVPCKTYLCIEDNRLVGMVNIRYSLNEYCFNYSGNIGYSVRKSERKKGYATEILNLALTELKKKGINRVLMTCNKSNIASSKVIIKNGGIYENEVLEEDGNIVERYWIDI